MPSASNRYPIFTSEQAWPEKAAAIHTFTLQEHKFTAATSNSLQQELKHITQMFLDNGYSLPAIQRMISIKTQIGEAERVEQVDGNSVY